MGCRRERPFRSSRSTSVRAFPSSVCGWCVGLRAEARRQQHPILQTPLRTPRLYTLCSRVDLQSSRQGLTTSWRKTPRRDRPHPGECQDGDSNQWNPKVHGPHSRRAKAFGEQDRGVRQPEVELSFLHLPSGGLPGGSTFTAVPKRCGFRVAVGRCLLVDTA
jgi:hypothetical protein